MQQYQLNQILLNSLLKCEELKNSDVISDYSIELNKENERLCLNDMVTEFDAVIDINLKPKKSIQYITTNITIMKSGDIKNQ